VLTTVFYANPVPVASIQFCFETTRDSFALREFPAETADATPERLDTAHSTSLKTGLLAATTLRFRVQLGSGLGKFAGFLFHSRA
jgi:hypothetical protein